QNSDADSADPGDCSEGKDPGGNICRQDIDGRSGQIFPNRARRPGTSAWAILAAVAGMSANFASML
ncbi:hypothetical protein, partial [Alistipes senegalensis]|uniref:hypothetical protein n=1 Tax=Alistipes senegalensis TaxID=1288121 RepID=UPI0034A4DFAC